MSWKEVIDEVFVESRDRFSNISSDIWSHPEQSLKEEHAHDILTSYFEEEGFLVERNFLAKTGFKATFQSAQPVSAGPDGDQTAEPRPHVCLFCEYDSLPELGHAGGLNLSCEASVAAAVAIKKCFEKKVLSGKITVFGVPGKEAGHGLKVDVLNMGLLDEVDFCMHLSPLTDNILFPEQHTLLLVSVKYTGKASHASAFPWEGLNALDAAVSCYNNIALLKQTLKPSSSINGIIANGGVQANVVPKHSELRFWLRSVDHKELFLLKQKCTACFVGAAKATGCHCDFDFEDKLYGPVTHNEKLGRVYEKYAKQLGIEFIDDQDIVQSHIEHSNIGSSDIGNVSQLVPVVNPCFSIGTNAVLYSEEFKDASGAPVAQDRTLMAAKSMALTVGEVLSTPALLQEIQQEHSDKNLGNDVMKRLRMQRSVSERSEHSTS